MLRGFICILISAVVGCSDADFRHPAERVESAASSRRGSDPRDASTAEDTSERDAEAPREPDPARQSSAEAPGDAATPPDAETRSDAAAAPDSEVPIPEPDASVPTGANEPCDVEQKRACGERECVLTSDGPECMCKAPAYVADGDRCTCAEGYTDKDGVCLANDGQPCTDALDCVNDHCVSGICCALACESPTEICRTAQSATCADGQTCAYALAADGEACEDADACTAGDTCKAGQCEGGTEMLSCDDGNACTDDTCDPGSGCKNQNNAAACDDGNPCTSADTCRAGTCGSDVLVACPIDTMDPCNVGSCELATGTCGKLPVPDGMACDDGSTCTLTDQCVAGACVGQGNVCGPNATGCTPGEPNACVCAARFLDRSGHCVPEVNECDASPGPCDVNATCLDVSNEPSDVTCTCNPGYSGDGRTCLQIDACADQPCGEGRGTCAPGMPGEYACTCAAGFVETGGTCACNLGGTFVLRSRFELAWANIDGVEDGVDFSNDWAIARQTYDASGALQIELSPCGSTTPDLCGTGYLGLVQPEAYGQYMPQHVWTTPSMPRSRFTVDVPNAIPGAPFQTDQIVALLGISLDDPAGPWPASRADIAGGDGFDGSATNGARWIDVDDDGLDGLTGYSVEPRGVPIDGAAPDPLVAYPATSSVCPRSGGAALDYAYLPAQEGFNIRRVKRLYSATRVVNAYQGQLQSCDRVSGDLVSSDGRPPAIETRFAGCIRENGGGETPCDSAVVNFMETSTAGQEIRSAKFVLQRIADDATCADARAAVPD
jgi:EGF domain